MPGETPESRSLFEGPRGLDVIRLDGRWAQVLASGEDLITVRFLDDGSTASELPLRDYELVRRLDTHVGQLEHRLGEGLSDQEQSRLYYGEEQREHPEWVNDIRVFGEYRKRQ